MTDSVSVPILEFKMGSVRTAFILDAVVHVFDAVHLGEFPEEPPADVIGVINVRGLRLPLIDIRRRWGMPSGDVQLSNQLVVVECEGQSVSILVDEVIGTRQIQLNEIVRLCDILPTAGNAHMAVADMDGIVILLDTDRLFDPRVFKELMDWVEAVI